MDNIKIEKLGTLLATSPLAPELKEAILQNIAYIPADLVEGLVVSLENESQKVEEITQNIEAFFAEQDIAWKNLAQEQKKSANGIIEEELAKIEAEIKNIPPAQ